MCELNVDTMLLNNFSEMLETVDNDTPSGDETCQKKDILQNLLTELIIQLHKETFKATNCKIFIGYMKKDSKFIKLPKRNVFLMWMLIFTLA